MEKPGGKAKGKKILFWSPECRYDVILNVVKRIGWKLVDDEKQENRVNMYWIDIATIQERFRMIQPWQMINHFPGMPNIARKNRMGQNLNKMQKIFPKEYSFYPRTWVLPAEMGEFRQNFDAQGNSLAGKVFIIKPDAGCQGRGIFLTRTFDMVPQQESVVAQTYIKKPLLLDGFKFDLRIYVLVTCIKPLRMYLFHDGLVRMCTEEYVKPTKQNISQTCMHLTNYAVNKHNSNFVQPSAKSSEEKQDEGSKRSLHWFMTHVRENYGDTKADWLWNRIGILCVRTLLSILPTLSREYDQHFKSFNPVPFSAAPPQAAAPGPNSGNNNSSARNLPPSKATPPARGGAAASSSSSSMAGGGAAARKNSIASETEEEDDGDDGEDEDEDDDKPDGEEDGGEDDEQEDNVKEDNVPAGPSPPSSADPAGPTPKEKSAKREPSTRGSRCFEVLGYDIMIDSNLKPWLIEVNHLPSFGTDSPLDRDIKDRLMQQVFKVLPTRSDDEQAYIAHHKSEAGKRLTGRSSQRSKMDEEDTKRESSSSRPPAERVTPKVQARKQQDDSSSVASASVQPEASVVVEPESLSVLPSVTGAEENPSAFDDEPVTPERLQEIFEILTEIYIEHSPEKVSKIGRLLQKYVGREEEFLRFVYHKYNIPPRPTAKQLAAAAEAEAAKKRAMAPKPPIGMSRDPKKGQNGGRTLSRSLSPPPSNSRRAPAVWRCAGAEEDVPFRNEVLGIHIPAEDDIWMEREQKMLTEFTRIFPKLPKREGQTEAEAENEDNEGDDVDEEGVSIPSNSGSSASQQSGDVSVSTTVTKFKPASYEDIIVQAFILDKRQTMRLHGPLAARLRPGSQEELPPLDYKNGPLPGGIGSGAGKGVVGWRTPMQKPTERKEVRVPTQAQLDAAKRLSLGLSVARDGVTVIPPRSSKYANVAPSVVLDPDVAVQPPAQNTMQLPPYPGGLQNVISEREFVGKDVRDRDNATRGLVIWSGVPTGDAARPGQGQGQAVPSNTTQQPTNGYQTFGGILTLQQQQQQQYYLQMQQQQQQQQQQQFLLQQQQQQQGFGQAGFSASGNSIIAANQRAARLLEEGKQTRARLEAARVTPAAVLRQQVYRFAPTDPNAAPQLGIGNALDMAGLAGAPLQLAGHSSLAPQIGVPPASTRPSLDSLPGHPRESLPSFAQHVQHQKLVKQVSSKGSTVMPAAKPGDPYAQDVLLKELFPGWWG